MPVRSKPDHLPKLRQLFQMALLRAEKCDLAEARQAYASALKLSKKALDHRGVMEALAGLLRLAVESQDAEALQRWEDELTAAMKAHPRQIPAAAWFCRGVMARHEGNLMRAQRHFHRYLQAIRRDPKGVS